MRTVMLTFLGNKNFHRPESKMSNELFTTSMTTHVTLSLIQPANFRLSDITRLELTWILFFLSITVTSISI